MLNFSDCDSTELLGSGSIDFPSKNQKDLSISQVFKFYLFRKLILFEKAPKRARSDVWNSFSLIYHNGVVDKSHVQCLTCSSHISYFQSTSAMKRHAQTHFQNVKVKESFIPPNQLKLDAFISKPFSAITQDVISRQLILTIAECNLAFRLIEHQSWKKLLNIISQGKF